MYQTERGCVIKIERERMCVCVREREEETNRGIVIEKGKGRER